MTDKTFDRITDIMISVGISLTLVGLIGMWFS